MCAKPGQFHAATAHGQRLLADPATTPAADSEACRLYLALIDATKHPSIHGNPTVCQTAAQIAPVLTAELMPKPTISLAMMSLMLLPAKDDRA